MLNEDYVMISALKKSKWKKNWIFFTIHIKFFKKFTQENYNMNFWKYHPF